MSIVTVSEWEICVEPDGHEYLALPLGTRVPCVVSLRAASAAEAAAEARGRAERMQGLLGDPRFTDESARRAESRLIRILTASGWEVCVEPDVPDDVVVWRRASLVAVGHGPS